MIAREYAQAHGISIDAARKRLQRARRSGQIDRLDTADAGHLTTLDVPHWTTRLDAPIDDAGWPARDSLPTDRPTAPDSECAGCVSLAAQIASLKVEIGAISDLPCAGCHDAQARLNSLEGRIAHLEAQIARLGQPTTYAQPGYATPPRWQTDSGPVLVPIVEC